MDKKDGDIEKQTLYARCGGSGTQNKITRRENSKNGYIHSRLDYWFLSVGLSYLIQLIEIHPGNRSDHSLINLTLDLQETQQRGKGFWKFNNSLLNDSFEYVQLIKSTISEIRNEFLIDNKNTL